MIYELIKDLNAYKEILLCCLVTIFLCALGMIRFYASLYNRVRKYQLDYLKYFNIVTDTDFRRFIKMNKSLSKEELDNFRRALGSSGNIDLFSSKSSITLLSLNKSLLIEFNSLFETKRDKNQNYISVVSKKNEATTTDKVENFFDISDMENNN
ncbi:unnamed protein product [Brachionus calyciflorus]|uniref:Uncharacterized protein n=1 Tax=Brachionus calyciflorus TaxID=104777 RepID=A0A813RX99_9BILA|nr:unnamed protein product [Brachionus calyciflorus]